MSSPSTRTTVFELLETGRFERSAWVYATAIPTTYIGAIFSLALGSDFEALRWSGLVMGWLGVLGTYALCREAGARPTAASLGAATIALNPLYLCLAFSFMSDVPFAAFCVWALAFGVRGLRKGSTPALIASAVLAVLASASRQPGIVLFVAGRRSRAIHVDPLLSTVLAGQLRVLSPDRVRRQGSRISRAPAHPSRVDRAAPGSLRSTGRGDRPRRVGRCLRGPGRCRSSHAPQWKRPA
jgi:hypothetical protein